MTNMIWIDDRGQYGFNPDSLHVLRIYRGCLSFLCRRLDIDPEALYHSLYDANTDYMREISCEGEEGLLYHLEYYGMDKWHETYYTNDTGIWGDFDAMDDLN